MHSRTDVTIDLQFTIVTCWHIQGSLSLAASLVRMPAFLLGDRSVIASLTTDTPACTCVDSVVGLQLVFEAELLATAVALIGLLSGVDALVALQCALVPEAAAAELTLIGVVSCKHMSGSGLL